MLSALSVSSCLFSQNKAIGTDPTLKFYMTMEQMYALDKTNWVAGSQYVGNIATGAVSDLFQNLGNPFSGPSTTTKKWGLQSFYLNQGVCRQINPTYVFPQSTGLSFCLWYNMAGQNESLSYGGVFGLDSNSNNLFAMRMKKITPTTWAINIIVNGSTYSSGGTDIPGTTINANQWNHYVWTISPALYGTTATHKVYFNNSVIFNDSLNLLYPTSVTRTNFDLCACANNGGNISYMDTFRHYTKELNASEINNIYNNLDPNLLLA
jgi:hypothetical protein